MECCELRVKRLHKYHVANSCKDLKTMALVSQSISSSMVFHQSSWISGLPGASKLLFVTILVARFWDLCNLLISTDPQQSQTEQQY